MWHVFHLRPDPSSFLSEPSDVHSLTVRVLDWVSTNKTKSAKVRLVNGDRIIVTQTEGYVYVKFRCERDAVLFKMFFANFVMNDTQRFRSVVIPLIRRAMPGIIAADIIGCSPMTGPVSSIFRLRTRYRDKPKLTRKQKLAKRAQEKAERKAARWLQTKKKKAAKVVQMTFKESNNGSVKNMLDEWRKIIQK